jgi:hypothetical protein
MNALDHITRSKPLSNAALALSILLASVAVKPVA